jgi:hypothetical protein
MNRSCQRQTQVSDLQRISDGNRSQAIANHQNNRRRPSMLPRRTAGGNDCLQPEMIAGSGVNFVPARMKLRRTCVIMRESEIGLLCFKHLV